MSKQLCIVFGVLFSVFMSGCAVGPILSHDTGQTVGDGDHKLQFLQGEGNFSGIVYDYGLTKNLDLGIHYETLSAGLRLKYAFVNNKSGFSLATTLGAGSSFGGSYNSLALVSSYRGSRFEPFFSYRYTVVESDVSKLTNADSGGLFATIPAFKYSYGQVYLGTKYWFTDSFALSIEAGSFVVIGDVSFASNTLYSVALDVRM